MAYFKVNICIYLEELKKTKKTCSIADVPAEIQIRSFTTGANLIGSPFEIHAVVELWARVEL